ncbi:putative transcriptional regulatory protein [Frankliniella fusca]|uniref:Transcriptional regulatory protein n=1 Tax=Frankliniella fusca TaxID=407009 RepID=A0AAE1LCR2_9NEOP|nr:putative transcriptional regulatory protein [Frankliniella fusca]
MFCQILIRRSSVISSTWHHIKRSAGHSKWANIRHTKALKDGQKASLYLQKIQGIKVVLSANGWNTDPDKSPALAKAIDSAIKANVPKDTIENYLKRVKDHKEHAIEYRLRGPRDCILNITFTCTNVTENDLRSQIKKILKKSVLQSTHGFGQAFEKKGVIFAKPSSKESTMDDAEEAAIIGGAEEVRPEEDQTYRFLTDPKTVWQVNKYLTENQWNVLECSVEDLPSYFVELSDEEMEEVKNVLEKLQEIPEYLKCADNIA